jgi:hypothetical protein
VGGQNGIITGSVSYTSEFYGGLTFSNSSSAVIFPGTTANYGTGSFTVEMAFKPTFINGRHYLMSKNSGSFPNWAIYLSGSAGTGKLWSEFRINASVSCSVSSSTTFVTGSVYQVDVRIFPGASASGIYVNGQIEGGVLGNGGGSLANTGSLFVGNFSQNNTQNFSGSIYTVKSYTVESLAQPPINYNVTATRLGKAPTPFVIPTFELLVVAGGGGSRNTYGGGGGAGGLQYFSNFAPTVGRTTVVVGAGGVETNGNNSSIGSVISLGGGFGAANSGAGGTGGSGGGSSDGANTTALGIPGQGNNGGVSISTSDNGGAGGGGAGEAGRDTNDATRARQGGSGSFITSFAVIGGSPAGWFAGGGAGGINSSDTIPGGIGGGGNGGGFGTQTPGVSNTGGGGAGAGFSQNGTAGGSGIVAIRYSGAPIAVGGEITQSAGYTYHVFRTVGTSSFTIF